MGINKEINQASFRNEYHKALVNVIYSSNWILERVKKFVEKEDITHQQYNILRILRGSDSPLSTLQIRDRMLDNMSDTSRIVERLIKKELAHKVVCSHDKRLVDVTITLKGNELLLRLDNDIVELDNILYGISGGEAEQLNILLDKMRDSSSAAPQK